jgi:4-hydroxybenzoyl-CoA reductase subunit beta
MLCLPPFAYHAPESLAEAVALLMANGPGARVVAGGTDLFPRMKRGISQPPALIGLAGIPGLAAVDRAADGAIALGAAATLAQVAADRRFGPPLAAVAEAAASVATPTLRRMGTVGGNLCQEARCRYYDQSSFWRGGLGGCLKADGELCRAAPGSSRCWAALASDLAPALLALDASLDVTGPSGARSMPLADLYSGDGLAPLALGTCDVLSRVVIPANPASGSAYEKLRPRAAVDYPELGVAFWVRRDGDTVGSVRLALGAIASAPILVDGVAAVLSGERPTAERLAEAGRLAATVANPIDNGAFGPAYRRKMVAVLFARAFERAWSRAA